MHLILKALRSRSGLTAIEAAERIGVTRAMIYCWESGDKEPGRPSLLAACDVYGATEAERAELARLRAFGPTSADVTPAA